jgi:hypothetical protein
MKDYIDFPPFKYFIRVLKSCPQSALLYIQIWCNKNDRLYLIVKKKDVRKIYLISPTMFRNLLSPLMYLSIIHFTEDEELFRIDALGTCPNED